MPSMRYMTNMQNDYVDTVCWLRDTGTSVGPRGLGTIEQTAVTLIFPSYRLSLLPIGVDRRVNTKIAALEALQLIGGVARSDLMQLASPSFTDVLVAPDNPDYGAYGPRLADRLRSVVDLLRDDPSSRRAVATIWEPRDLTHDGDRPCTLTLQFMIRDGKLDLHVNMRSQDVWLGLTYDAFMFSQIQDTLAGMLDVPIGQYVHHVASLHLYETDVDKTRKLHYTADQASLADQLPRGVRPVNGSPFTVARRYLNNQFTDEDLAVNRWYAARAAHVHALRSTP